MRREEEVVKQKEGSRLLTANAEPIIESDELKECGSQGT